MSLAVARAAVVDSAGVPVRGLEKTDFEVRIAGHPAPVALVLAPIESGLDLGIAVSLSRDTEREWPAVRDGVGELLAALDEKDCVYLAPFHGVVDRGQWGRPQSPALRDLIANFPSEPGNRFYDALLATLEELAPGRVADNCGSDDGIAAGPERRSAVVLIVARENDRSQAIYADALITAWRTGVAVIPFPIAELDDDSTIARQLAEIARVTGGRSFAGADPRRERLARMLAYLRSYYVLGVAAEQPDGMQWRDLEIEVPARDVHVLSQPTLPWIDHAAQRAIAHVGEAQRAYREGNYLAALEAFRAAARLDPDWASPEFGRGAVLERMGLLTEAKVAYEGALSRDARFVAAHARLAMVAQQLGDMEDAWEHGIRAHVGGVPMKEWLAELELTSPPLLDREDREDLYAIYVDYPPATDLLKLVQAEPLLRRLAALIGAADRHVNALRLNAAGVLLKPWRIRAHDRGGVEVELRITGRTGLKLASKKVRLDSLSGSLANSEELDKAVNGLLEWVTKNVR